MGAHLGPRPLGNTPYVPPPFPRDPFFNAVSLLLHGDGTNGAQNNTFIDSSTNNFTITRNGNTTQGTNTPFSQPDGAWSNYFDGTGDYLTSTVGSTLNLSAGDFTIEYWIYKTANKLCTHISYAAQTWRLQGDASGTISFVNSFGPAKIVSSVTVPLNSWNHVALSRSGSTTTLYINGVSAGTCPDSTTNTNETTLWIGTNPDAISTWGYAGYISNIRIVKGSAVYTANFTPPTTPLTAITNTSLLTCQSNNFKDNSSNNFAITRNGDTSVQPFSPFAPTAAYSTSVNGGSMYFDGTGDYLSIANNAAIDLSSGDFTLECWVYWNGTNAYGVIFDKDGENLVTYPSLTFGLNNSGYIRFAVGNGTSAVGYIQVITSSTLLPINSWVHLAGTRNGTTLTIYQNGINVASATQTGTMVNGTKPLLVGYETSQGSTFYWNGYISNARVVKGTAVYTANFTPPTAPLTAITNTQLLLSGTNAGIFDNAAKNNLETVGNAQVSTAVTKFGTGSMSFDGTGDYLKIPNSENFNVGSGNFTLEMWVYKNGTAEYALFSKRVDSSSQIKYMTAFIRTNGTVSTSATINGSSWAFLNVDSTTAISTATWTHVAWVRNGSDFSVYIAGVKNTLSSSFSGSIFTDSDPFLIGHLGQTGIYTFPMNGFIDDIRITKGIERYTANFTPPTEAFLDQ